MIFGIGLGRTGTNTLTACLRKLGLRAHHGQDLGARLFDRWWIEPLRPLPDQVDAVCESPFTRWYRAADRLHPGSRFIFTTRDKEAWLQSVERWLHRREPPKESSIWFKHRMHHSGRVTFDREVHSDLYDAHHESVMRYFADRDDFGDAIDFVGWYTDLSAKSVGISKWDPYNQYLAYHEGQAGWKRKSYSTKRWLKETARVVDYRAKEWGAQLARCEDELDDGWWIF